LEVAAVTFTAVLCAVDFSKESPHVLRAAVAAAAPFSIHRLLVAVDFTPESMRAIKEAATQSSRWKAALTLLHAVPAGPGFERWKTFLDLDRDKRIERARHDLELLAAEIANERAAVRVIAVGGSPEEIIARYAAEEPGTLIVMGLRAPISMPPGSGCVAYRVLCTALSPVLILPDVERHGPRDAAREAGARQQD
jgi:nucleotide-binding universal stress UspA family protein